MMIKKRLQELSDRLKKGASLAEKEHAECMRMNMVGQALIESREGMVRLAIAADVDEIIADME